MHAAQLLTYIKLPAVSTGLLVNFNFISLRQGLRRLSLPPPTFLIFPIFLFSLVTSVDELF